MTEIFLKPTTLTRKLGEEICTRPDIYEYYYRHNEKISYYILIQKMWKKKTWLLKVSKLKWKTKFPKNETIIERKSKDVEKLLRKVKKVFAKKGITIKW